MAAEVSGVAAHRVTAAVDKQGRKKITIDGGACKGTFECYADDENLLRIRHLQGKRAMFVLASPDAFNAERKPAETSVVGDLSIPKDGERADEQQLQQVGQGQAA